VDEAEKKAREILPETSDGLTFGEKLKCRQRITQALRDVVKKKDEEIEVLAWNLGGCSTYALGYNLEGEPCKDVARPALLEVRELRIKYDKLRSELEEVKEYMTGVRWVLRLRLNKPSRP